MFGFGHCLCLGGGSVSKNGGLAKPKDVIVTSTVLNATFISPFWALFNQNLSLLLQGLKMPVGCLGGGSASNNGGLGKPMDVIVTSTVLNAADQFAFMQQTLLMQIFRLNHSQVSPTTDSSGSNNGANGNG